MLHGILHGSLAAAMAACRTVMLASWESSQEQKGTGTATPTAQERGHSHPVPLLQPCLGEAIQKSPEAMVGPWIFCPSKGDQVLFGFAVLVRTFFIFQTRFLPSVKAGNAITVPGSVVAWNKETRQYPKKIHKEEKKHSQYCPVFIDTVSLCHLFTRGVTCQQLHQYCFM